MSQYSVEYFDFDVMNLFLLEFNLKFVDIFVYTTPII